MRLRATITALLAAALVIATGSPSIAVADEGPAARAPLAAWPALSAQSLTSATCSEPPGVVRPSAPRRRRAATSGTSTAAVMAIPAGATTAYSAAVLADGASSYWRLGESSGTTAVDDAGSNDLTVGPAVSRGATGVLAGDTASTFSGTTSGTAWSSTPIQGPDTFSAEAWFRTTSASGGTILGFGDQQTGDSSNKDRLLYMTGTGQVVFGVYPGRTVTLSSGAGYNDGAWHHVVGTMGSGGMALHVDGVRAGSTANSSGQDFRGYWRVGGDTLDGWPQRPASGYLSGSIDEVALYPTALTLSQVQQHFTAAGRTVAEAVQPTDPYGAAVFASGPDSYWRLTETSGSRAEDASPNSAGPSFDGVYDGGASFGTTGAVALGGTAVSLDGSTGAVAATQSVRNPTVYSTELWFRTTTLRGGKLIGFGNQQTGRSGSYDRHVYMLDDGRLLFGTWTGQVNLAETSGSYNDGRWHHVVATQGTDGMRLYVDGALAASNPQTAAEDFTGFWRVGGDRTWGGASSDYFAGAIDEVAVYSTALSAATVAQHFALRSVVPNTAPVAAFSTTTSYLTLSADASSSADSGGAPASYAWDFGDGTTSTGVHAQHTYATAGTYLVTLTVTDREGATGSTTASVTVTWSRPAAGSALAGDGFHRTVQGGWGSPDTGGDYLLSGGSEHFSVSEGVGRMELSAADASTAAYLPAVSSSATDARALFSVDRLTDGVAAVSVVGRWVGADSYRVQVCVSAGGPVRYALVRIVGGVTSQLSPAVTLPGPALAPGEGLDVRLQVTGAGTSKLAAKLWRTGQVEPARWGTTAVDRTATLQAAGSVGLVSQLSGPTTDQPVVVSWSRASFATVTCSSGQRPRRLAGRCSSR